MRERRKYWMRDLMDIIKPLGLYEADEHQWMLDQIEHLRAKRFESVDRGNLIQYLTEMTKSDERALGSAFTVLMMHLLKFMMQPERASRSWAVTVIEQQQAIEDLLTPSMETLHSERLFAAAYPRAVRRAAAETGISASKFPPTCPWTIQEVMAFQPPAPNVQQTRD